MIKCDIQDGHRNRIEYTGNPVDLAAEIGALISYLYAEIDSINPIAGLLFKKGVQVALEEDSVVWQYDKNYRANPESQVITMIKPRHDDGQAL